MTMDKKVQQNLFCCTDILVVLPLVKRGGKNSLIYTGFWRISCMIRSLECNLIWKKGEKPKRQ
jgi:hypothetical protein